MTISELKATRGMFPSAEALYKRILADPVFKEDIEKLYKETFGRKPIKRCSNCWFDAYMELSTVSNEKIMEIKNRKFELRAGVLLKEEGLPVRFLTAHNLTDDLAVMVLRKNPFLAGKFSKLPSDWKKQVLTDQEPEKINVSKAKRKIKVKQQEMQAGISKKDSE